MKPLDFQNPPPALGGAASAFRETLKRVKQMQRETQQRIAAIQADREISEEKRARDVAAARDALLTWYDASFRLTVGRVAEAVAAVEAAVERTANPDPLEVPHVDITRATAGESAIAHLTRAAITTSARAAEQVAAQRAESLLAEAIARDPVNGAAKLRRELAGAGDRLLERAFDRVAPMRVDAPGARALLEEAQAEIRDSRLDEGLRELVAQTSELNGMTEFLVGLRADMAEGDFIATGRSPVMTGLQSTYPGIAE